MFRTKSAELVLFHFSLLFSLLLALIVFAPLLEIIEGLPPDQLERWERLYMLSDRRGGLVHPLIYSHPTTGLKVSGDAAAAGDDGGGDDDDDAVAGYGSDDDDVVLGMAMMIVMMMMMMMLFWVWQ